MNYKIIDKKSYKIHTMKTKRFKTTNIEVLFRTDTLSRKNLASLNFLFNLLLEGSLDYPTKRDIIIKQEDLYSANLDSRTYKIGDSTWISLQIDFINPEYIDDKNYLSNVIQFLFNIVLKPNIIDGEFALDNFERTKRNILLMIDDLKDNSMACAMDDAFNFMNYDSYTSYGYLGTKEIIEDITPKDLADLYYKLINEALVDIFVVGNTNMANIVKIIENNYKNHFIRSKDFKYFVDNKNVLVPKKKAVNSKFSQGQLINIFNINGLSLYERDVVMVVFNFIFSDGGLNSKLYKYVREENSLCYRISSMFFKYDNILCVSSSLDSNNAQETMKLIKKALLEMRKGNFLDSDIADAKESLKASLKVAKSNPYTVLSSYIFKEFSGALDIYEKEKMLDGVTKEDIMNVASKIKLNTVYIQKEVTNG